MADPPSELHSDKQIPDFTHLNDLASEAVGGQILFATDDWFATAENLLKVETPVWKEHEFTDYGKWMDGWETRRKRIPGHDWCIIQIEESGGVIEGVQIDTSFFTGNFCPKVSIQAVSLKTEYQGRPTRQMGTAATEEEFKHIDKLHSQDWETILPTSALGPGYKTSCHNYFKIESNKRYTHLRLNMFPDGGIARLRAYGFVRPDWTTYREDKILDLAAMVSGGLCVGFSNNHYGHPRNMIMPGRAHIMAEGWETARRLDRPEVLSTDGSGHLLVPGMEWAELKLGHLGVITQIEVDTNHFKGNFPESCLIEGTHVNKAANNANKTWRLLLPRQKLRPHQRHFFSGDTVQHIGPINRIRLTIAPDGGISRLRLWGYIRKEQLKASL